jgi:hypothetical protein
MFAGLKTDWRIFADKSLLKVIFKAKLSRKGEINLTLKNYCQKLLEVIKNSSSHD